MKRASTVALVARFGFFFFALILQGVIPAVLSESETRLVTRVVLTPSGEMTEMIAVQPRRTELEELGKEIYMREGCWYCHSQYIRPVTGEDQRWGPVSEAGEYAYDQPHALGTRRIGPDLTRIGGRVGDDWHIAHFLNPRLVVPDSVMPQYRLLFTVDGLFNQRRGADLLNEEGRALVAYVQSLGTGRGRWIDVFLLQEPLETISVSTDSASIDSGRRSYERRCASCHGVDGDGNGPAAKFMVTRPRDFTSGIYKLISTGKGNAPTDQDLYRTISMGMRGTAMPAWKKLPEQERSEIIAYIKTFSPDVFLPTVTSDMVTDALILTETDPGPSIKIALKGREVYQKAGCVSCHGESGRADGPAAATLQDDWGDLIQPTDFSAGILKSGPSVIDVMRTVSNGIGGTPMPQWSESLTVEQRWAVSYYVWALGADDIGGLEAEVAKVNDDHDSSFFARLLTAWQGHDDDLTEKPVPFK